jgi:type IV pilus assembly protein PilW
MSPMRCIPGQPLRQRGLSLVELMVALVLGLFLVAVVLQIFLSSRLTYSMSDGLARAQENARFAVEPLNRDLRMAGGNAICAGDAIAPTIRVSSAAMPEIVTLLSPDLALQGWEYSGTGANTEFDFDLEEMSADADQWSNGVADLPDFLDGRAAAGSDVLALRVVGLPIADITGCNNNNINSANIGTCSRAANGSTPPVAHGVAQGTIWAAADCGSGFVDICRQTNAGNATNLNCAPGGGNTGLPAGSSWDIRYANQTEFYLPRVHYYFVGASLDDASRRALFRASNCFGSDGGQGCLLEEIAEGIDSLQLFYRIEGDASLYAADSIPDDDWTRVRAVSVNLVASSPTEVEAGAQARSVAMDQGLVFAFNDRRVREVYGTTVALRNRITVH